MELPRIVICAQTYFYAPSITETVLSLEYCMNPETNGGPKNKYTSEEASEYHPQNINKHPEHKKFMEKIIKIAAKRHKYFEKEIKAREKHKLDLSEYGVGEIIEETKTTNITSGSGISDEIKELKIHASIEHVMSLVRSINKYLEVKEPWKSLKEDSKNQSGLNALSISSEAIALSAKLLYPVMPKKCEEIFNILGVEKESINNLNFETISGNSINPHKALFPRIENDD